MYLEKKVKRNGAGGGAKARAGFTPADFRFFSFIYISLILLLNHTHAQGSSRSAFYWQP
jgi:hypothetical protein